MNHNGVPANTRRWPNAGLMLAQRLRRWANIKPALWSVNHCELFARGDSYKRAQLAATAKKCLCFLGHSGCKWSLLLVVFSCKFRKYTFFVMTCTRDITAYRMFQHYDEKITTPETFEMFNYLFLGLQTRRI